jgi:hypothetical protein
VAPLVLIGIVAGQGFAGWIGIGVFFLLLGAVSPAIAAWGERTRPQATTPDESAEHHGADTVRANAAMDGS